MYRIETQNLRMELEVVPVESLLLHERILPHVAGRLILEFKNWASLQNPIIIDRNNIVLDGNHRAFVFRELKIRTIAVCRIDYFEKEAQLRYWYRVFGGAENLHLLREVVEDLDGSFQEVPDRQILERRLGEDPFLCGVQMKDRYAVFSFADKQACDAAAVYDCLETVQTRLLREGMRLEYVPCHYVRETASPRPSKDGEMVIWTPRITKEMVVDCARQKKLFAPKSTRHLIPARPLHVNVPTQWFREDIPMEEINRRFRDFLRGKELRHIGPGQVIDGRYYEEKLFVFYDRRGGT
ncbi:MAG: hypothetical protein JXL84_08865 [Deltaproteobacteria bacterium]|nr:hypothetical protein [Deltaproteobacteria bacterium]